MEGKDNDFMLHRVLAETMHEIFSLVYGAIHTPDLKDRHKVSDKNTYLIMHLRDASIQNETPTWRCDRFKSYRQRIISAE